MTKVMMMNSKNYYNNHAKKVENLIVDYKLECQKLLRELSFSDSVALEVVDDYEAKVYNFSLQLPKVKDRGSYEAIENEIDKFYYFSEDIKKDLYGLCALKSEEPEKKMTVLDYISNEILYTLDDMSEYIEMANGNLMKDGIDEEFFIIE